MFPPGQSARADFPRFGIPNYASRFPSELNSQSIDIGINSKHTFKLDLASIDLPQTEFITDFHCVTTWSFMGAKWRGIRFIDVFRKYISPLTEEPGAFTGAVVYAQDGYKTSLILEDLLSENVLLAHSLDDRPLQIEHGAPLRLVALDHYGYKNVKYLSKIDFHANVPELKRGIRAFQDHPRVRVVKEERGRWVPGWILRFLYRPLISGTVNVFCRAYEKYKS